MSATAIAPSITSATAVKPRRGLPCAPRDRRRLFVPRGAPLASELVASRAPLSGVTRPSEGWSCGVASARCASRTRRRTGVQLFAEPADTHRTVAGATHAALLEDKTFARTTSRTIAEVVSRTRMHRTSK